MATHAGVRCHCGGRTFVDNSGRVPGQNVVMRQRRCLDCREVFKTYEVTEGTPIVWEAEPEEIDTDEPLLRSKLYLGQGRRG